VNAFGLASLLRLATKTSVMGSFVPCQRDDIRRPATSTCPLEFYSRTFIKSFSKLKN